MAATKKPTRKREVTKASSHTSKISFVSGKTLAIVFGALGILSYFFLLSSGLGYDVNSVLNAPPTVPPPKDMSHLLTKEEWRKWYALTEWLIENGMPRKDFFLTLAYFEHSGRGVACTKDIEAETPVVIIPFKVMMSTNQARQKSKIGKFITKAQITLTDDSMVALFLLFEKLKGTDSFWHPYIDFLPNDYFEMAIFLTPEEKVYMEGLVEPTLNYEYNELNVVLRAAQAAEKEDPVLFKGLANETALKWALAAVWSRMWHIEELGGRALVPLADLLNHHPEKGTILVPNTEREVGTIKALQAYKKGDEFYDKYFIEKVESDGVYYATYGFLLSFNYFSTYPLDYYWVQSAKPEIQQILDQQGCTGTGPQKAAVSDLVAQKGIPEKWTECMKILALDELPDEITVDNYVEYYHKPSTDKRALQLSLRYFQDKLAFYKTGSIADDQALLVDPTLNRNMKTLVTLRMSEKLVLNNTIIYIQDLLAKHTAN